eukprot:TRINITY_DN33150_c0_g1_i1.p1 TRINITY_DN33150_c0_g1~~TRINITY_DN33150_c0_g1_i1.p1  ORF type:complete len:303 (+),score=107.70 TRINITY_DN33150_c0_g1_i1:55-909(+)
MVEHKGDTGAVVPPAIRHPHDKRLYGPAAAMGVAVVLLIVALTLPLVEVTTRHGDRTLVIGEASAWRADFKEALGHIGVGDDEDTNTSKGVAVHFLTRDARHRETAEDILRGHPFCGGHLQGTCEAVLGFSRTLVKVQGMLCPAVSVFFGGVLVLPLAIMRARNQALLMAIFNVAAFALLMSASGYLSNNLHGDVDLIFARAFGGRAVAVKYTAGAVLLFTATGFAGAAMVASGALFLATDNDPYPLGDGPNYTADNPQPLHFLPMDKRPAPSTAPDAPPAFPI